MKVPSCKCCTLANSLLDRVSFSLGRQHRRRPRGDGVFTHERRKIQFVQIPRKNGGEKEIGESKKEGGGGHKNEGTDFLVVHTLAGREKRPRGQENQTDFFCFFGVLFSS